MDAILKIENLTISFGGIRALNNVSFEVEKGAIYSIIGPNGAGKTTIFNCISRNLSTEFRKAFSRERTSPI